MLFYSLFQAYVWGSDIDFMMLHGRTKPTRVGQKVTMYVFLKHGNTTDRALFYSMRGAHTEIDPQS